MINISKSIGYILMDQKSSGLGPDGTTKRARMIARANVSLFLFSLDMPLVYDEHGV